MVQKFMIYEVRYNKENDAYETWVANTEGTYPKKEDFSLEHSYKCESIGNAKFVNAELLFALARALYSGYEIDYRV